jgi:hypothetical protein
MKQIDHCICLVLLLLLGPGCEKENTEFETDIKKAILGKWEVIEMGNWPDLQPVTKPSGYVEYLPDSIMREYDYETGEYFYKKYWIDTLLHKSITREDGYELVYIQAKIEFFEQNKKIRLDYVDIAAIFNTFIYKKLN